jgi:DnaJ family protein C protein 2
LNKSTGSDPDELFNLCVYSETVILKALRELGQLQLSNFKSRLKALGVEIGDPAYHHQRACDFGERLAQNVCKFDLSPAERAKAVQNLRLPGYNQDPIDTDTGTARERLHPRSLLYRKQQLEVLIRDANIHLAGHLQSLLAGSQSPPQTHFDVTEFQGPSDSLLCGDNSLINQLPIIVFTRSDRSTSDSRSKNRFAVVTDIKHRVQEATEEFVDILLSSSSNISTDLSAALSKMAISTEVHLPLPILPRGWSGEKDFKAIGTVSKATQRSIEPVGPHFLAHARRARHKRTFSEDDRIQAQESVKKVEDDDAGEISEPEDPAMLMRDAKDWKVNNLLS